jgi:hypothetical protein
MSGNGHDIPPTSRTSLSASGSPFQRNLIHASARASCIVLSWAGEMLSRISGSLASSCSAILQACVQHQGAFLLVYKYSNARASSMVNRASPTVTPLALHHIPGCMLVILLNVKLVPQRHQAIMTGLRRAKQVQAQQPGSRDAVPVDLAQQSAYMLCAPTPTA